MDIYRYIYLKMVNITLNQYTGLWLKHLYLIQITIHKLIIKMKNETTTM